MTFRLFIGWDPREETACRIAMASIAKHSTVDVEIVPISMETVKEYRRPTLTKKGKLWDKISQAPMSTSHAIARFFVPYLCNFQGVAVFMDGDVLIRRDIAQLFALADPRYPLQCVKHCYRPEELIKKNGDEQIAYHRKNWSSVVLWNCGHSANRRLTPEMLNIQPGLYLHEFSWLHDEQIGELPGTWNTLITEPALVHFTEGIPSIPGRELQPYAQEWHALKAELLLQ
jgi:lipopolysaccharide biosynthesis glycosyltransferase